MDKKVIQKLFSFTYVRISIPILTFIILGNYPTLYGQVINACDSIYNSSTVIPKYGDGPTELYEGIAKELIPIISNCVKRDREIITKLLIVLSIDKNGNVIEAEFMKPELTERCKDELKNKLLSMKKWIPAQIDEQHVCSKITIPISCIKWN